MTTVEKLLDADLETLLAAFFNSRKNELGDFEITSKWLVQLRYQADRRYAKTAKALTDKYKLEFEMISAVEISATIENDGQISLQKFQEMLYLAIAAKMARLPIGFNLDQEMALAMFIFRGSPDLNRSFYAVDLLSPSDTYLENIQKLLLSSDDLLSRLNLNFRDLQPQFVQGEVRRNTQIRVNLKWFYDNVLLTFPNINSYKFEVVKANLKSLGEVRAYPSFENRIVFYREKIIGRALSKTEIDSLRNDLKFALEEIEPTPGEKFAARNQKIIAYARETFADLCTGCSDLYPIENRSFEMPRNGRFYFEVNHVIAYSNDSAAVDVLDNLVKLCATCHRALTPRRAHESLQKSIIKKMLDSRDEVRAFVEALAQNSNEAAEDFVFQRLK
jgi:5-methylcytosine-specific restriction protein A